MISKPASDKFNFFPFLKFYWVVKKILEISYLFSFSANSSKVIQLHEELNITSSLLTKWPNRAPAWRTVFPDGDSLDDIKVGWDSLKKKTIFLTTSISPSLTALKKSRCHLVVLPGKTWYKKLKQIIKTQIILEIKVGSN